LGAASGHFAELYVDTAGFLQNGWEDIGTHIKIEIAK